MRIRLFAFLMLMAATQGHAMQERGNSQTTGDVEQARSEVQSAMATHRTAIRQLRLDLDAACRTVIKDAANQEQFDRLRSLLDARDRFLKSGDLPSDRDLVDAVQTYKDNRKRSALAVVNAFRAAVANEPTSASLKTTLENFIEEERAAMGATPRDTPHKEASDDSAAKTATMVAKPHPEVRSPSPEAVRQAEGILLPNLYGGDFGQLPLSVKTGRWVFKREEPHGRDGMTWSVWSVEAFFDIGGGQQVVKVYGLATSGDIVTTEMDASVVGVMQDIAEGKFVKKRGRSKGK